MSADRTRLDDHFPTGELFEEVLAEAVIAADKEGLVRTLRSLHNLHQRWQAHGMRMYFSANDCTSLCRIAGITPPGKNCSVHD